ncbi:MAG: phospholipid carrier-dependent glycosyltransferase, partial [Caldilineaceae bacterium]|nr:phospholipid carrier-dependent glycosyltransferase [Caldilineaceae bacterium]
MITTVLSLPKFLKKPGVVAQRCGMFFAARLDAYDDGATTEETKATADRGMAAWLEYTSLRNLLLLGFLLLGFWYSLATPPFETPDELYHYGFVRHIAQGNWLPVQQANVESPWEQEGSQAPLYYLLVGWLTRGIDQSDFAAINVRNPRANIGDPLFPGNKNFMRYSSKAWPLVGSNLALHIGRWLSMLLGALTLIFTYGTARLALPAGSQLALVVLLTTAMIPQFAFISASFSNDSLINAAAAATIFWLAWLREAADPAQGTASSLRWWHWLILGGLVGIAALSKLQGLGLLPVSALVGLWSAWRQRDWRLPLRIFPLVALPLIAIAGWWYWR